MVVVNLKQLISNRQVLMKKIIVSRRIDGHNSSLFKFDNTELFACLQNLNQTSKHEPQINAR